MRFFFRRPSVIIPVLLFLVIFGIYIYTSPRIQTSYADSEELIAAAYTLGVPHPPGYPLFPLIGKLFALIPIGTIAFRFSIFSSFFSTLTVVLVYLIIYSILSARHEVGVQHEVLNTLKVGVVQHEVLNTLVQHEVLNTLPFIAWSSIVSALIGALCLAFSYIFWLYAITPETCFLVGFFIALSIFILVCWYQSNKKSDFYPFVLAIVLALGFLAQQLFLLIIPAVLYFVWIINRKIFFPSLKWLKIFGGGIIGLLPLIYLPLAALREPFIDYGNPTNFIRFWHLITRYVYKLASPEGTAYLPTGGLRLDERIYQVLHYFIFLIHQFTPIVIVLAILGMPFFIIKKSTRRVGIFILLIFVFTGPAFAFYAPQLDVYPHPGFLAELLSKYAFYFKIKTVRDNFNAEGALERQFLISFTAFSIFIGLGVFFLLNLAKKFQFPRTPIFLFALLFFLIPIFPLRDNFGVVNKRNFYLGKDYAENLFMNIKPNAILITRGDRPSFAAYYYQQVEKKRLDVTVISFGWRSWNIDRLKKKEPNLFGTENQTLLAVFRDIINTNIDKRPLYVTGLPNAEIIQLGVGGNPYLLSPRGLICQIGKIGEDFDAGEGFGYWQKMTWRGPKDVAAYYDQYAKELIEQYLIGLSNSYYHYASWGYNDLAKLQLEELRKIAPNHQLTKKIVQHFQELGGSERIARKFILGEAKAHSEMGQSYLENKKVPEAMSEFWTAVYIEPENLSYKYQLGLAYEFLQWYKEALEQYENILASNLTDENLAKIVKERMEVVRFKIDNNYYEGFAP